MGNFNKNLFKKLVEGPERSDDYARNKLPSNRWALGWDLIKINMGKIIKINLLLILFLFPLALLYYFRELLLVYMILEPDQHSSIYKTLVSGENALTPINN